ncbi:MAG: bifunctional UDP-3-O-[3-hydroxymyristoyl] N-acetylglucosamine deacetylase/3-hydroxyacyl-ACP dehydratase [Gemmatimonadota bacterium]|nr:bifunctional UDP-3-O-[3-hydroxymyristoyl] N-acetylglucosamine deacetylase/3-hydroxyacyl-ACP dehydratase [Gemmatimonadota bacterium]MDE3171594.1 bifunctional UDP-3-O-[3-hydroxymyristoyl] N-acetylglucosamine deacetylase/3-hydroxyacyl-ACP dehydratase [Gemmatimonadota bacterium]MDE3216639.1 bifunctional UDP-3-O-[3-hydroxymyristoyl] N-acetylglucosamine deacetylase/3-hydroxyacyl-ACP dehydratase [Gemmatimonadota bacterium]
MRRRTIAGTAAVEGVGLHLGVTCRLTFHPAPSGQGIAFRRTDLPGLPLIAANVDTARLAERRTQIGEDPVSVHTVEHVLAAVGALGIDDLTIDLDGPEPPIADGSAAPFLEALRGAGIAPQPGIVQFWELREPVRVTDGESVYEAHPADGLELDVTIDFPDPLIGRQRWCSAVDERVFSTELARARTFGFVREVEPLRAMGLIRGASTQNTVVVSDGVVLENALRWPDEFVRHKALDCVGDLTLAGARVRARVVAVKPSHRGTVQLVRAMREALKKENTVLDIDAIIKVLPHRYPFLLVDRVLEMEPRKRIVGLKNVTINEPFFQGHFPGHPIMPGVLIIEAMAQVGGMLLMGTVPNPENKVVYFTSLDNVKWRRPVRPGDQLRFELEMIQIRGPMCKMKGVARVDGEVVAEAEMGAMVRER